MSKPPNFNRLAGAYLWMERLSFGPYLALTRNTFLNRVAGRRRALVLGDGDGRFSASLLRANPQIALRAVDGSPAMLRALLRRAGPHAQRVQTEQADLRAWQPPQVAGQQYDLVVTHFFLDCLTGEQVQSLATRVRAVTAPGALWVVSDFAIPSGWFGRLVARPLVAGLYAAFHLLTGLDVCRLPDHASALRAAGFTLLERRARLAGLLFAELWTVAEPRYE